MRRFACLTLLLVALLPPMAALAIDSGSSSNYSVNTTDGYVAPTATSAAQISQGTGSNIGNMTSNGGLAAAFDSNTNQANSAVASTAANDGTVGYVGKDYSGGGAKKISHLIAWPSNGTASVWWDNNGDSRTVTLRLYGKESGTPANATDGTLLGTNTATWNSASSVQVNSSDTETSFESVWLYIDTSSAGTGRPLVAEVQFFEAGTTNNATIITTPQTADSTIGNCRVLLEYNPVSSVTVNTDLTVECTCDGGSNWNSATLSGVGKGQAGREVAETDDVSCGANTGTSFAARIKTLNNKTIRIHGVTLTVH